MAYISKKDIQDAMSYYTHERADTQTRIRTTEALKKDASQLATKEGRSLSNWIITAMVEKILKDKS